MLIRVARILGVLYGLFLLIGLISTVADHFPGPFPVVPFVVRLMPAVLLTVILLLPHARLPRKYCNPALIILSLLTVYFIVIDIIKFLTPPVAMNSAPPEIRLLCDLLSILGSVILLAQPVAVYFIHRRPSAPPSPMPGHA